MNEKETNQSQSSGDRGVTIYVVDDEPMLLELAMVILETQGYVIKTFRDPELALQSFGAADPRPSLVITDFAMHSMNGMQLIEMVRRLEPKHKILLVSGTVGEDIFKDAPERPDRFLAKPYRAEQLIDTVRSLLEKE